MSRATGTVDLVVVGGEPGAIAVAIVAAERGERVLVVLGPIERSHIRCVRRSIRATSALARDRVAVMINAELACVDGIGRTEAVVVRHVRTGRLTAFNARRVWER